MWGMLGLEPMTSSDGVTIRRELAPGDMGAIAGLHGSVYAVEHEMGPLFEADVATGLARAADSGWPERSGGVWIVENGGRVAGSMAWTDEGDHAKVRWVLLHPDLRGRGLARGMLSELLAEADEAGHELVVLDTFSDLRAAAGMYRSAGFVVVGSQPHDRWGPTVELQRYELRR
jgi:ribosomal protein S18 acetylase RimI-like enzyme